jgi:fluoroquinolone transport system ATP-binding protein
MISVNQLRYSYKGSKEETLKGINFEIPQGEIFGFLGPSGAGKSTIQKVLIGILKQYQGTVEVMGQSLDKVNSDYYEKIGVAFEFPNFYNRFTALENLNFFRSLYTGQTEEPISLLRSVGLEQYAQMRVSDFSKGMKMRLNLCRALINDPQILFLDEPTSGLDPANSKLVKDIILRKKQEGRTILITTHHMLAAEEICDRVAFIVDGQVRLIDAPRALKLKNGQKHVKVEYSLQGQIQSQSYNLSGLGNNEQFLNVLRDHDVQTIHSQETTLEQIFIEVTGRRLNEQG